MSWCCLIHIGLIGIFSILLCLIVRLCVWLHWNPKQKIKCQNLYLDVLVQEMPEHAHSAIDWWAYTEIRNRMPMWYWRQTSHISTFGMCRCFFLFETRQGHEHRAIYSKSIVIHAYVKSLRFTSRHRRILKIPSALNMNTMELIYNLGRMAAVECVALYGLYAVYVYLSGTWWVKNGLTSPIEFLGIFSRSSVFSVLFQCMHTFQQLIKPQEY